MRSPLPSAIPNSIPQLSNQSRNVLGQRPPQPWTTAVPPSVKHPERPVRPTSIFPARKPSVIHQEPRPFTFPESLRLRPQHTSVPRRLKEPFGIYSTESFFILSIE